MKVFFLVLIIFAVAACGGGPGTTPDSVQAVRTCYYGYGGETCAVSFDDGLPGYTVQSPDGRGYICKGAGL